MRVTGGNSAFALPGAVIYVRAADRNLGRSQEQELHIDVIPEPHRRINREPGVESSLWSVLAPRALPAQIRGLFAREIVPSGKRNVAPPAWFGDVRGCVSTRRGQAGT